MVKYARPDRDRHAPLTLPGLTGRPGSDDWYGILLSKSSLTRWAYDPTHCGMGCTTLTLTFKTDQATSDLDLAVQG
jgi:hypothetical protein